MVNFSTVIPSVKTAGQALVKKLGPNLGKVTGTVGTADIKGLKFADMSKAVEGIEGAVVGALPKGGNYIKLKNCCKLQGQDIPKNVVMTFNKEGDCLMLSGAGTNNGLTQGFSLRTQKGIDALLDAGVKNPGERVSTVIQRPYFNEGFKFPGGRWFAENSGTPTQDVIAQAYEYPHLGKALKHTEIK